MLNCDSPNLQTQYVTHETEYQTIFTVYSSKGQQRMYKLVNKQPAGPTHTPTAKHKRRRDSRQARDGGHGRAVQVADEAEQGHQVAVGPYKRAVELRV